MANPERQSTPVPVDFGWANSWKEIPEIVKKCRAEGHKVQDVDVGPLHRGMEHVIRCEPCGYTYRVDSSD